MPTRRHFESQVRASACENLVTLTSTSSPSSRVNNQRIGKLIGLKKTRFFFREAAGPGFALVGDAGLHKDPTPGIGITDALRDARSLARAIIEGSERALQRYHRQRDVDSFDLFHFAKALGDPEYVNPFNRLVFEHMRRRPDLLARMAKSSDRELPASAVVSNGAVMRWVSGAVLRGRFSVVPPMLAAGKRASQLEQERGAVWARLEALQHHG